MKKISDCLIEEDIRLQQQQGEDIPTRPRRRTHASNSDHAPLDSVLWEFLVGKQTSRRLPIAVNHEAGSSP